MDIFVLKTAFLAYFLRIKLYVQLDDGKQSNSYLTLQKKFIIVIIAIELPSGISSKGEDDSSNHISKATFALKPPPNKRSTTWPGLYRVILMGVGLCIRCDLLHTALFRFTGSKVTTLNSAQCNKRKLSKIVLCGFGLKYKWHEIFYCPIWKSLKNQKHCLLPFLNIVSHSRVTKI